MEPSREKRRERRFLDVHFNKGNRTHGLLRSLKFGKVIDLRIPAYKRYPSLTIGIVLLLIIAVFGINKLFTKAEVGDFYPVNCLGSWQNPQKAQGEPENFRSETSNFNEENSSVKNDASGQIFCGNFLPENFEPNGKLRDAGLTLVWQIGETPVAEENPAPATETNQNQPAPEQNAPINEELIINEPEVPSSTETPTSTEELPLVETPPTPAPEIPPPSESGFFKLIPLVINKFFPLAFAEETITSEMPVTAEEPATIPKATETPAPSEEIQEPPIIIAPPITAELSEVASTTENELNASATIEIPLTPEPELPAPPPPDENFLKISYSLDGQNWIELNKINQNNWQNFTINLPVNSWEELKKLQISVEGMPTTITQIPKVYLDGMLVEAHYDLPLPIFKIEEENSKLEDMPRKPEKEKIKTFDPEAKHKCSIEPFSQTIKRGDGAIYDIHLMPSFTNSVFELQTGDLPPGVSANLDQGRGFGAPTPKLKLDILDSAVNGSFDIVVIYRETKTDMNTLTNFCQLNLIIE